MSSHARGMSQLLGSSGASGRLWGGCFQSCTWGTMATLRGAGRRGVGSGAPPTPIRAGPTSAPTLTQVVTTAELILGGQSCEPSLAFRSVQLSSHHYCYLVTLV